MEAVIIAHTNDVSQLETIKAFFKALKIKFEVNAKDQPYNPEFVAKIKRSEEDFKNGRYKSVKIQDLSKYIEKL